MLSEDIRHLAGQLRWYQAAGLNLDLAFNARVAGVLDALADQARQLEGQARPIDAPVAPPPIGGNVVRLRPRLRLVHRPDGAA